MYSKAWVRFVHFMSGKFAGQEDLWKVIETRLGVVYVDGEYHPIEKGE